jgi:probable HAF family extracellular repeat protein
LVEGPAIAVPGGVSRCPLLEVVMQARHSLSLFLLSLTIGLANAAWAHPEYRVTVVAPANSAATDINNHGVVVGNYPFSATSTHAFLNRGKGLVDLGTLRGTASDAVAINDKCQVLGHWTTAAGQKRGFIYYRGERRDIGVIPGSTFTFYTDINDAGFITANGFLAATPGGPHSFLRAPDGTLRDIGSLPFVNPVTNAFALNHRNQITGESGPLLLPGLPLRAFIWAKGVMRDLGDFGTEPNAGLAINDRGQITGFAAVPGGNFPHAQVAFLYSNGRLIDIDGRRATATRAPFSTGTGINIYGHIVGSSDHLSGFIYRGKRMESLNALIDPRLGWNIQFPQAINDAGQIAANAYRNGVQYAVRLDLIRPHAMQAPALELDDEAAGEAAGEADAKADVQDQTYETVQPVKQ